MRMPANGHVIPSTPIAVDLWNMKNYPQARVFFLSHFHADHIVGLTSSWQHPIYTSPVTAKFLIKKLKIAPDLVRSLEIGEDHLIPLDDDNQEMVTVTLLNANHCPGSVMFLFSGYFGDILYTGDFRYKPGLLEGFSLPPIDVLYLDNTYCSPKCVFPTRDDAIENILSQLSTCLVQSNRVFVGLDNLGKEDLLQRISKERQCKIHVCPPKKEIMDILEMNDIITADKARTKVFVVPTNQISGNNLIKWNNETKTHAIVATARYCGYNFKPYTKFPEIHVVPYSNHSSYYELKEFVKLVRPRTIIPIVSKSSKGMFGADISDRADMSVFKQFLRDPSPFSSEFQIPESVKRTMNACEEKCDMAKPVKRRKVARPKQRPLTWRRPMTVGVRYIVSEDSETDSDPDAVHIECDNSLSEGISEYSSDDASECDDSENVWEITHIAGKGNKTVYYLKS